jgi:uncharacterized protein YdeI (YjbR/CyaY-like superfamily)
MKIIYFKSEADFRRWLTANHDKADEIGVGIYKKASGKTGITYKQAVDSALCFGWIDGIARGVDDKKYYQRFTPRRKRSIWSQINLKRFTELKKQGLVHPAGLKTFESRDKKLAGLYSFENPLQKLDKSSENLFKKNKKAWNNFSTMPQGYKKTAIWWVVSAKKDETRRRRLAMLIKDSAQGRKIKPLA